MEAGVADDACVVCGRPATIPMVSLCGDCAGFTGQTFETMVTAIREGRFPVESIDWANLASSALRIATRSDEVDEKTDRVVEIIGTATRIAESLWAVTDEIRTAIDGGEADADRVAGAINDGIAVLYGEDGAARLVQAGIRITLDLLSGDSPREILRGVLEELLPGWMMSDLWLDQLFEPPTPPKPMIPEHDFTPANHQWRQGGEGMRCTACGLEVTMTELVGAMSSQCPEADPTRCAVCGEVRRGHAGQMSEDSLGRLDALAEEHLAAFRRALDGEPAQLERSVTAARKNYFEGLGDALDGLAEDEAGTWLRKHAQESFQDSLTKMKQMVETAARTGENAESAWIERSYPLLTHPYRDMMPPDLDPMEMAFVESITPGDPMILYALVKHRPDHPISVDYNRTVTPSDDRGDARRATAEAVRAFGTTAREWAESRGGMVAVF